MAYSQSSMLAVAHTTDTPVWWLVGVTAALVFVTGSLAVAAFKALRQIAELTRDRQVDVFAEFGRRWDGIAMTEALSMEKNYSAASLTALFQRGQAGRPTSLIGGWRYRRDGRKRIVLLRIPNFFEDAALITKAGGLDGELLKENLGGIAADKWRIWSGAVAAIQQGDPLAYVEFERLAKDVIAEDAARATEST